MTRDQRYLFSSNWRNVCLVFLLPKVGVFFSWCVVSKPTSHFHHHTSWILQRDKRIHTHTHTHLWYCFYLVPKEIQPVPPKGNQSWIFIGRTGVEAETPILWPPDAKNRLIGKDPDAGNDWRLEEKGMTENEMVGWHHWLNGHEFE